MNSPNPSQNPKKTSGEESDGPSAASSSAKKDAIELLKADHHEVDQLFSQFQSAKGRQQRKKLIEKIAAALTAHTMIEEEIFYPACREKGVEDDDLDEAQVEHDTLKILVADLLKGSQDDDYYDAKVTVLSEYVKHHVGEEEKPGEGIFARAKSAGLDMDQLGRKLQSRKDDLMEDEKRLLSRPPRIRSIDLSSQNQQHSEMGRYPTDRYREDQDSDRYSRGGQDEYRRYSTGRMSGERDDHDEDYSPNRGAYGQTGYGRSSQGYSDEHRPDSRRIEQSASGGRYRNEYGAGYERPENSGRSLGSSNEGRDYYQGTRYGSEYGGGRYPTSGEDDHTADRQYGDSRSGRYGNGDRGNGGDGGRYEGSGSGFRGNR